MGLSGDRKASGYYAINRRTPLPPFGGTRNIWKSLATDDGRTTRTKRDFFRYWTEAPKP